MDREQELRDAFTSRTQNVRIGRGAFRRLRPYVIDADARAHVEGLKANNEAFRRLPKAEHDRIYEEVHREYTTTRRRAASVALHHVRAAEQHLRDWERWVKSISRDVTRSFPEALRGVSPDGAIMLALLRDQRRAAITRMSAQQLQDTYDRAFATKDAAALVDLEILEDVVLSGTLAIDAADLPVVRQLREQIEGIQDLRVPMHLPDITGLAAEISSLHQRSAAAQIEPIDPSYDPSALAAYQAEESHLLEVGTPTDREAMELAKAAGE